MIRHCCVPGCGTPLPATNPTPVCRECGIKIAREFHHDPAFTRERVLATTAARDEARRQRQSRSVVYYVRLDDQRIKIGYSSRLRERVSSFRVHPSALLAFEPGGRDLERRRHEQFAAERAAPLEEFSASPRLMRWIDILREENGLPAWAKVPDTRVKVTRT